VDKAAEYMEKAKELDERDDPLYEVRARRSDGSAWGRGIYLREPLDAQRSVNCSIEVRPVVHEASSQALQQKATEPILSALQPSPGVLGPICNRLLLFAGGGRENRLQGGP
jgi:hypothetical protein